MPEKAENDKSKQPQLSRLESLKKNAKNDSFEPDMPDAGVGAYLIGYLFEIGPVMSGAVGSGPVTHQEVDSWQRNTGIELSAWEARTIRRLSVDYMSQSHKATNRDCPAPWNPESFKKKPNEVARSMRAHIANLTEL